MTRFWLASVLCAAAWLYGTFWYHAANGTIAAAALLAGVACCGGPRLPGLSSRTAVAAGVLSLLAAAVTPFPLRAVPLLAGIGCLLHALPSPRRWPGWTARALVAAGGVLAVQRLTLWLYAAGTARSHELPGCVAAGLAALLRLLHLDVAASPGRLTAFAMRETLPFAPSWELLADPLTVCSVAGLLAMAAFRAADAATAGERRAVFRAAGRAVLAVAAWLPLRAALVVALVLHRVLLVGYDDKLEPGAWLWNRGFLLALEIVPLALIAGFGRVALPGAPAATTQGLLAAPPSPRRAWTGAALLLLAAAVLSAGVLWHPSGSRKTGRVLVDELHSDWERTDKPFDTSWYGRDAGYNYAAIYDFCSRYYDMGRLTVPLGDAALASCDVLILKCPTKPYETREVEAVLRFVERGGGLLLVGEHTDVFRTSTHLNQIAAELGFRFRPDCLFGMEDPFHQSLRPGAGAHPVLRHVPYMDFAISCSIAPGASRGDAVVRSTGLWSLPADYHASNFYPQVRRRADARYGAFVQLWSATHGRGRVLAFCDSTIFSNFSSFEEGKSELMVSMVEWLNRRPPAVEPFWICLVLSALLGLAAWRWRGACPALLLAAAFAGWRLGALWADRANLDGFPYPNPVRPVFRASIDRAVCSAPLSLSGFIMPSDEGFGIFEQWLIRLGCFPDRRRDAPLPTHGLAVFLQPDRVPPRDFARRLAGYVRGGGRILVLDSVANAKSTANSLLYPFGLRARHDSAAVAGLADGPEGWPSVPIEKAVEIEGGTPLLRVHGRTVAAWTNFGKGMVAAVGAGLRFADSHMGGTTEMEPSPAVREVYELQYALVRALMAGSIPGLRAAQPVPGP
jgi:hypothetical protein